MKINIIQYQIKSSLEHLASNSLTQIEDIKVLIISDNINIYKEILLDFNSKIENIRVVDVSSFEFFTNTTLKDNSFDLIIGNPPNRRQEKLKDLKPIVKGYKSFNHTADLNIYYFEKGYNLLKENGILSFITSNKYAKALYAKEFRAFVLANIAVVEYIDFTDKSIMTFNKSQKKNTIFTYCKVETNTVNLTQYITGHKYLYLQSDLEIDTFNFYSTKVLSIKKTIENYDTIDSEKYSLKFSDIISNSKVIIFYRNLFYAKDIQKLPIPKISKEQQKPFEILVDYILFAKENDMKNEASLFESIIDGMVYDLYFEEDMKKADCFITSRVEEIAKPWSKYDNDEFKKEFVQIIYDIFKEDKTIQRGLLFSRNIEVVKVINQG